MQGITMWIVLGVLVAVVIGFLFVSSTLDKKKRKIAKEKHDKLQTEKNMAIGKISIFINQIVKLNNQKLKSFVPSVGKEKMSDINNYAKHELEKCKKTNLFKLVSEKEEVVNNFLVLLKTKSNNWSKQCDKSIKFFFDYEKGLKDSIKNYKEFKEAEEERLEKVYKNDNSE